MSGNPVNEWLANTPEGREMYQRMYPAEVMGVKLHELKAMADAARAIGAKRLRIGDCEVELAPVEAEAAAPTQADADKLAREMFGQVPSDDDLLHWSVPGPLPSEASKA